MPDIFTTKNYVKLNIAREVGFTTISLQGSSRSSKTWSILQWLCMQCHETAGTTVSVIRASMPAIRRTVYRDFKEVMIAYGWWNDNAMNKSEFIYNFGNGSWLEFFSADNEQKLRGSKRQILFVNEANELSFIEWQQLQMRTTSLSIIDYNPSFSEEHWINQVNKEKQTFWFISTYKDNPFLEDKVVQEIESLQLKNETLWQVYGLGMQAVIEGLVFKTIEVVDEIPEMARKHRWRGMDFGFSNDPTAIVDVYPADNALYIDEVCYNTEMLASDVIRVLKENDPLTETISESADPRLIQEIHRAGINIHPVQKFPGSIDAGLSKMQEYSIRITRRSYNTIKEFKNYTWAQDKDGHWLNKPIDAYNHAIDAIRYVVMMKILGGRAKPVNISRLAKLAY